MKTLAAMLFALTAATSMAQTKAAEKPMTETFKVDTTATTIKWSADKKIGSGHAGTVSVKNGNLVFTGDLITAGEMVVDMNTITSTDIPADQPENGKLVGHLKSPDFFNVEKHPESKLVIKGSEKTAKGIKIKGDLTMLGKTNAVEFEATVNKAGNTVTAKSDIVLDRTKWDLKYGSENWFKLQADRIIKNDFKLSVDLKATK